MAGELLKPHDALHCRNSQIDTMGTRHQCHANGFIFKLFVR